MVIERIFEHVLMLSRHVQHYLILLNTVQHASWENVLDILNSAIASGVEKDGGSASPRHNAMSIAMVC